MSAVKLRLSGFSAYTTYIVSTLLGYAFTMMVTRKLSVKEYGAWQVIGITATYFWTWISPIYNFWVLRNVARGELLFPRLLKLRRQGVQLKLELSLSIATPHREVLLRD